MFYALKGEAFHLGVEIIVKKKGREIARYARGFDRKVHAVYYEAFVKKFLESPEYREDFLFEGEWDGVLIEEKQRVNPKCLEEIERIKRLKNPTLEDFSRVKTFGIDEYSKMKLPQLAKIISLSEIDTISSIFEERNIVLSCARWVARGLPLALSIEKVKSDRMIKEQYETQIS